MCWYLVRANYIFSFMYKLVLNIPLRRMFKTTSYGKQSIPALV